jgi:hypothetical protein
MRRPLITLNLHVEGILHQALLCLSLYLEPRRDEYYELLDLRRGSSDWEAWLAFCATGGVRLDRCRRYSD